MEQSVTPITVRGKYLWKGEDRFIINGVVYQPHRVSREAGPSIPDPLTDDQLEELEKSIPLFKELGLNTLFVFFIDTSKSHDAAMNMLAEAGIYVLPCLSTPHRTIRRSAPFQSYTADLARSYFRVVDCVAAYRNTLGVVVANEIINSIPSTAAAPVIRALTRDVKRYMALAAELAGQRVLPVGVNSADVPILRRPQLDYFTAGDESETIDFYAFNCYSWCGEASMRISGYDKLEEKFRDAPIPVFFSEYGANAYPGGRQFHETRAILSPAMTGTFSGGIVYEFFEAANRYGLVARSADGSLERLPDFEYLRASVAACRDARHSTQPADALEEVLHGEAKKPEMPECSDHWKAKRRIPESPVNWDEAKEQIEDREWVDVERDILDLEVEDLAATVWQRFRIDGTGPRLG